MKIIAKFALAAVAAAGLALGTTAPAGADVGVPLHKHCLLTPDGWVLIAEGVTDYSPDDSPALDEFHYDVHLGTPTHTGGLSIKRIDADEDCSTLPVPAA